MLKSVRPQELRYYLGSAHYRSMLEYSPEALTDAAAAYRTIETFLTKVAARVGQIPPGEWTEGFAAAMDDDLAVPKALAEIHGARREGNRALSSGDLEAAAAAASSIRSMTAVLGVDPLGDQWADVDESSTARAALDILVADVLEQRASAKTARDWPTADRIRDRLAAAGIEVTDTPHGPEWNLGTPGGAEK